MKTDVKASVYAQLRTILLDTVDDDFEILDAAERIDVNTRKVVVIAERKRPYLNLMSVIQQKHHVGFYFMPVYIDAGIREGLSDELGKMLKGKSCFHCKQTITPDLEAEIRQMIADGIALYRQEN